MVPREDVRATLEARRELGAELEPELVDAFVARIERRLAERPHRGAAERSTDWGAVVLGIFSLALAIPLIAVPASLIDSGFGAALAILAVCALLITINALYHERK
jgi:hypothetical protein